MAGLKIDYDSQWKELIGEFFEDFTAFFMPDLYKDVDFTKPIEFLEQELLDIFKTKYKGKRINDKLVKVFLKDGTEKWVLVHIEVQASFETEFAERMFLYYVLIYTKYGVKDITSIAIFTNNKVPKKYDRFEHSLYGTSISYKYNAYRVIDQKESDLLTSTNPFAMAVLANLYVLQTNQNYEERLVQKEKMFEIAKKLGYDEKKLIRLLIFVRNLMVLPEDLEFKFSSHIHNTVQTENSMLINEGDKRMLEVMYVAICGETPLQMTERMAKDMAERMVKDMAEDMAERMAERLKVSIEEAKVRRSIIRYFQKHKFEGLAGFCELLEVEYLFAEKTIADYLEEQKEV